MIDECTSKLIDMVLFLFNSVSGESLKITQSDDEPDARKIIPANKKADTKQTPVKKSPPFGKAMGSQNP